MLSDTELKNKIKKLIKYRVKHPRCKFPEIMKHPDIQTILHSGISYDKIFELISECKQEMRKHIKLDCCMCQKKIGFIVPKKISYAKLYNKDKYEIFCNDCYNTKYYY